MHRALDALHRAYGSAFAGERLRCGDLVAGGVDTDTIVALATIHRRCLAAALAAAGREGGPGWMARAGVDDASLSRRLWTEHGEPLTSVSHDDLSRS